MGDFNFACDKCPRTFKLEEFYEKHKKVHELKKQHVCNVCGFVYGAAKGLEGHLKSHEGERQKNEEKRQQQKQRKQKGNENSTTNVIKLPAFLSAQGVTVQEKKEKEEEEDEKKVNRPPLPPLPPPPPPPPPPQAQPQPQLPLEKISPIDILTQQAQVTQLMSQQQKLEDRNSKIPSPAGTGTYEIYDTVPEVNDASAAMQNESGFFMCNICSREFSGLNSLKKHIPIHTRRIQHKCDVCGYVFGKKEYLLDHMRKHTGEVSPVCEICGQTFNKSLKLKEHHKLHRNLSMDGMPFRCHICQDVFLDTETLKRHLSHAHAETVYRCDICQATFGDVRGKNHHMYNEHQLDAFHQKCVWCPVCSQGFTRHYNLKVHMYKSHGKEYIDNNFSPAEMAALTKPSPGNSNGIRSQLPSQQSQLKENNNNNTKPGPQSSKKNSKVAVTKPKHYFDKARGTQMLSCQLCTDKFLRKTDLFIHLEATHAFVLPSCSICDEKFNDVIEKTEHMALNHKASDEYVFEIPEIVIKPPKRKPGPASRTNAPRENRGTNVPVYVMSGQRKFECNECGKVLHQRQDFISHMKTVHGNVYKRKMVLDFCEFCQKSFEDQSKLREHMVNDHINSLNCELCNKTFEKAEELDDHQKAKHPNLNKRLQSLKDALGLESDSTSSTSSPSSGGPTTKRIKLSEGNSSSMSTSLPPPPSSSSSVPPMSPSDSPSKKQRDSACPICGVVLSPKTNINVHMRTHSGDRPYQCVLCLNRFRQKAHLMKHFRCAHNQKSPPYTCQFCQDSSSETSNDLYRHIADIHKEEAAALHPAEENGEQEIEDQTILEDAAISAAAAVTSGSEEEGHQQSKTKKPPKQPQHDEADDEDDDDEGEEEEDVRYEPITEEFYFENIVISPCYVVLPFVSEQEIEAACSRAPQEVYDDLEEDQGRLTIDESVIEDEADSSFASSPKKEGSMLGTLLSVKEETPFLAQQQQTTDNGSYNAEDIKINPSAGFYPNISDFSLPFSLSGLWKKKAEILGPEGLKQHELLEKQIKKINEFEKKQEKKEIEEAKREAAKSSRSPTASPQSSESTTPPPPGVPPPPSTTISAKHSNKSPGKGHKNKNSPNKAVDAAVTDYELQIQNDIWPLDCIKCNTLLGNLENFNLHMNDHWTGDKCCPVCGLLINSKRFNFKQHLKIHTGEKPFVCKICSRSFRQKAHMVKHVTTHRSIPNAVAAQAAALSA